MKAKICLLVPVIQKLLVPVILIWLIPILLSHAVYHERDKAVFEIGFTQGKVLLIIL